MGLLYSDRDIVVCLKPVGLDSETQVPAALQEQLGGEIYTLHRLDKNVGGVMVYARTKAAAAQLSKQIQEGRMIKEYVACVHGTPPEAGDWEDLLWKDSKKNKVFVVKPENPVWFASGSIPAEATRSGCYFPPGGFHWLAIINTVPGMKPQPPCSFPAALPSLITGKKCALRHCPIGQTKNQPQPCKYRVGARFIHHAMVSSILWVTS